MNTTIVNRRTCRLSLIVSTILWGLLLSACSSGQGYGSAASSYSNLRTPVPVPAATAVSTGATTAAAAASTPAPSQEHLSGIGSATIVTIHGKIVSVDRSKKLVTLEGPAGRNVTLEVRNPYNLSAAKRGERFVARFYEIVTFRKKRPGESIPAASTALGLVSAMPGQTPGGAVGSSEQVVVTIVAINKTKKSVDVKGPDGAVETVKVAYPLNLRHVKVGDDIVVTVTKVMAISLVKESST